MDTIPPIPALKEVQRIIDIQDPVIRNLEITQCYHDLAAALTRRTGMTANWCTFATWASKQAGQTIRKEDLARLLENRLKKSPTTVRPASRLATAARLSGIDQVETTQQRALSASTLTFAIDRASDAVGRGNKKVFEEIGYEFARFYQNCLQDAVPDNEKLARFCEQLRPGDPPEGQGRLREAFVYYYQAFFETDPKIRAELILLANLEIGFHEQTRLQPEIAESIDAGFISSEQYTRILVAILFPTSKLLAMGDLYFRRLLGRPTPLDTAIRSLHSAARTLFRETITDVMMTITLPSGERLRLGQDLGIGFPDSLKRISNKDLRIFLAKHDPTPDSTADSGARDWANLPDRLHFIIDLFRCCQENRDLFQAPFTPEQAAELHAGKLPTGRL